jgi:Fe-S-cluster formation regulator IscX/YfhJ
VINSALKTDDVLRRAINGLDLRKLLSNLDNSDDLTEQINRAVTDAVKQALLARLRGLI